MLHSVVCRVSNEIGFLSSLPLFTRACRSLRISVATVDPNIRAERLDRSNGEPAIGGRFKSWIGFSCTYLWALWFFAIALLVYALRGPLKITESVEHATSYFANLTPKFYVALTGTSSLVSGVVLIFEYWYFRNNNVDSSSEDGSEWEESVEANRAVPECRVWRNPWALLRGAEYGRARKQWNIEPLTFHDLNLSAQEHQSYFTCDDDAKRPDLELMLGAWRERGSTARIVAAHEALRLNPSCVPALILLAEEETDTVRDAESVLRKALKVAETQCRKSQQSAHYDTLATPTESAQLTRDFNLFIYIRRRLAMCARKAGRLRDAIKMMRDIIKEFPALTHFPVHENLIESYLEIQAYADVQALLVRYDGFDSREPKSAVLCYTSALLKCRAVADSWRTHGDWWWTWSGGGRRGLSAAESAAVEAVARAVAWNPHIPAYLLELRPLLLPPEHFVKRGDTEAIAYAFVHLPHWKRVPGALALLRAVWRGHVGCASRHVLAYQRNYSTSIETADRELLPSWHSVSVWPRRESVVRTALQILLCLVVCAGAVFTHFYPATAYSTWQSTVAQCWLLLHSILETCRSVFPDWFVALLGGDVASTARM